MYASAISLQTYSTPAERGEEPEDLLSIERGMNQEATESLARW